MFLNIITPCCRPENLHKISESINIPKDNYRWIVVFDMDQLPDKNLIPDNCEVYLHRNPHSIAGHSQRNFALEFIRNGYIYSNDDDTILHKDLWENIKDLDSDFITFFQEDKFGTIRLVGEVEINKIDSHNFIVKYDIIGETKFIINQYAADGYFAIECYNKAKTKTKIDKVLSTYNSLNNSRHR
jgi:hypothetical protein